MRLSRTLTVVAALVLLTACSSVRNGTGTAPTVPSGATGSPDFPSGSGSGAPSPSDTGGSTAPDTGTATSSAPAAKPLRTATVTAPDGTTFLVSIWAERSDPTCADHAHGKPVVAYLTAHKCGGLHRLLATTTVAGRAVGLAISDLGFLGTDPAVYKTAGAFVTLVKKNGTGNIDDLMRSGSRLRKDCVGFPGNFLSVTLGSSSNSPVGSTI